MAPRSRTLFNRKVSSRALTLSVQSLERLERGVVAGRVELVHLKASFRSVHKRGSLHLFVDLRLFVVIEGAHLHLDRGSRCLDVKDVLFWLEYLDATERRLPVLGRVL